MFVELHFFFFKRTNLTSEQMYLYPSLSRASLEEMATFCVLSQWRITLAQNVKKL